VTYIRVYDASLYLFYQLNGGKLTFFLISFVEGIQNDVQDDLVGDVN